jgi:predicted secreted protein
MINYKKCFFISIVLFVLFSFSLIILVEAQPSWVMWSKTFGGTDYDQAYSLVKTSNGGYALAGRTFSFGAGGSDVWLIKTDVSGNMEWNQTYGGTGYDVAYSLIKTSDDGFALAGSTGPDVADSDFWLVKTDGSGNMEWNQTYGGTRSESASSLIETSDGGYALAGGTRSFGHGNNDFWLVKTDGFGNMEWNRFYGEAENEIAYSLVETSDGGFALAGETGSIGAGGSDVWFIRTNEQGVPEFPSWIILPLFLTIASIILIYRKRMKSGSI